MLESFEAKRGRGDRYGPTIQEPLAATMPAAVERCRVEIELGEPPKEISIDVPNSPTLAPGDMITVSEAAPGEVWDCMVIDLEHIAVNGGTITRLDLITFD